MSLLTKFFPLRGGLNLATPAIEMPPGHAIAGVNYEPVEKGYARCDGYERCDGRPRPSDASYWVLNFDAGVATIASAATVTGATSGATGKAVVAMVVSTGSFGGSDAAGYLVLYQVTGTFQDNENLQVAASTKCVANGVAVERGAANDTDDSTWIQAAIEATRTAIQTVTGQSRMRGVNIFSGTKYCVRDNAGATAGILYKATTSGWAAQALGRKLPFTSGGTYEIVEGNTITGATSAATAVITRIVVTSGDWTTGDAAGYLIFTSQTGTFQAENLNVAANLNVATIAANSTANALPAGGRYEFVNHNFFGASNLTRMYGVNGVGPAFEWDGTVFCPISTGMATDTPNHIAVYKKQLILSFPGGSVQNSSIGQPLEWDAVTGAAEIGMGSAVTAFIQEYAQSLVIFARSKISQLIGNDSTDFVLVPVTEDAGAIEWTAQKIGVPIYHDDRGLRDMRTTALYGDFKRGTITEIVDPLMKAKKKAGILPIASIRCKAKDQYRLFWDDGTGLTVYLGRKAPEMLPFDLGLVVYCCCSGEDSSGNEVMLFGSDDGYVYELDAGTSFDGDAVDAYLRLAFNHLGTPTQNKVFRKATLDVDWTSATSLGMTAEYSYADPDQPPTSEQSFSVQGGGGFWNELHLNDFYWSAPVEGIAECPLEGLGTNVSINVISSATYETPHTLHGLTLHYSPRGLKR